MVTTLASIQCNWLADFLQLIGVIRRQNRCLAPQADQIISTQNNVERANVGICLLSCYTLWHGSDMLIAFIQMISLLANGRLLEFDPLTSRSKQLHMLQDY